MWETFDGWLADVPQQKMDTLADQGILASDEPLDVVNANKYTEVGQFISQNAADYTDLRKALCGCN